MLQKRKPWKRAVPPPLNPLEGPEVGTLGEHALNVPRAGAVGGAVGVVDDQLAVVGHAGHHEKVSRVREVAGAHAADDGMPLSELRRKTPRVRRHLMGGKTQLSRAVRS